MTYQRSNYTTIKKQIASKAVALHDDPANLSITGQMPYTGSKAGELPSQTQVLAAGGPPYLAVRFAQLIGYGAGGVLQSADMAAQGPSTTEPYWDWELFSLHPYDEEDPNYDDAEADMTLFFQGFNDVVDHTLSGTCYATYVAVATPAYVELMDGTPYTAAYLVIRTSEWLQQQ